MTDPWESANQHVSDVATEAEYQEYLKWLRAGRPRDAEGKPLDPALVSAMLADG